MNTRQLLPAVVGIWVVFAVLDRFFVPHGGGPGTVSAPVWDGIPGFYALFGFIGCLLLIAVSKAIGAHLQRDEGYYND